MKKRLILVGVGANLPASCGNAPIDTCISAVRAIGSLPDLQVRAVSRWYGSAPLPAGNQPHYVNGVIALTGEAEPEALLEALHRIEAAHERARSVPNAARTLDLDLLAVDEETRAAALVLPHPRLAERRFVLQPLMDVAPDWVHPVSHISARALLAALPPQLLWLHPVPPSPAQLSPSQSIAPPSA